MKKLPTIFRNEITKKSDNNMTYSKSDDLDRNNDIDVLKKINDIFTSSNYVYKADVEIKFKYKIINKTVIGRNKTHLITSTNELITISDIIDIKKN